MKVTLPTPSPARLWARRLAILFLFVTVIAGQAGVPFTVRISANYGNYYPDFPYIDLVNNSRHRITRMEFTIGPTSKNFDYVWYYWNPPGGVTSIVSPGYNANFETSSRADTLILNFTDFDPGETVRAYVEIDNDSTPGGIAGWHDLDYRTVFFNNSTEMNSKVTVTDDQNNVEVLELPDPGAADLDSYTFQSAARARQLHVKSISEEGGNDFVKKVQVKINNVTVQTNAAGAIVLAGGSGTLLVGPQEAITVYDDEVVEIIAPQQVYKNLQGDDITDSVTADPDNILHFAEERFTAIGLSVNNVAQTGDPTYYRFTVRTNTDVLVKWQHDFALSIAQDFSETASSEPGYAGPLNSDAEGSPDPPAPKAWIRKGAIVSPTVAGQVADSFSHPGLDIRFINKGYRAGGAAHRANGGPLVTGTNFVEGTYAWDGQWTNLASGVVLVPSTLNPPARQQVLAFAMSAPAKLTYLWQIQYGVKVNMDSLTRAAIPRLITRNPTNSNEFVERAAGEGTYWFNPGDYVRVATPAVDNNLAVANWINGDGFYFGASGGIDQANGQLLLSGSVGATATWLPSFTFTGSAGTKEYRGLEIPSLTRPARVLWGYGNMGLKTVATIGEFVFQNESSNANAFITPPDVTAVLNISGANGNVAASETSVWDTQAQRLYPVVPGLFRITWKKGVSPNQVTNDVILTVNYPASAHYPHIVNAPGVALDPDSSDELIFKSIKYNESNASVDGQNRFFASQPGKCVLQFGRLQSVGRGEPREFVQIRVVESKDYRTGLTFGEAIIGQKITAPDLDRALLGTGHVLSFSEQLGRPDRQRFNPFIYDATKLIGLAAKDVYDMTQLRSSLHTLEVTHRDRLPGPIIPVNLHPGAAPEDRIVVLWYENPALTDTLLWPARARSYTNRWPTQADGLRRITIASQFGSDNQVTNALGEIVDQTVADADATHPAEISFNPTRFQQVQIYTQANTNSRGFNPNEEHALIAPSLRYADVSPRPPAAYALRDNDLNQYSPASPTEVGQNIATYSSHPFVLVQYFDTADAEFKMRVYQVFKEQFEIPGYAFANQTLVTPGSSGVVAASPRQLVNEPHVTMEAGEPVIPFYPLGVVIGASPCSESFGIDIKAQKTHWEDHKGSSWAISGGDDAWFTASFYYPLQPDFYWPANKPGRVIEAGGNKTASVPQVGDCVSFQPASISALLTKADGEVLVASDVALVKPNRILYKSDWPEVAPVLKAGETLTFSGGEYRADHPTTPVINSDDSVGSVQTPGLPGIVAFAEAEVVFDSLNPTAQASLWPNSWTARVVQGLDVRQATLAFANFPAELAPASGRTRVKNGKYVFNDLPASLQKRFRYDPLLGKLELTGLLNDKGIGDTTLTASPPAVYVLEPNILTAEDRDTLKALDDNPSTAWDTAVQALYNQTRNPNALNLSGADYLVGLEQEIIRNATSGLPETTNIAGMVVPRRDPTKAAPYRAFGPGLALVPNAGFLNPNGEIPPGHTPYPDISWVTVAENNDSSLGGSPVTLHVIKVDRSERYRGAIKTITSDNVFDENLVLRHTGDFGANAKELAFEWWYRPDDGSLNVPPPDLLQPGQSNPWKVFPDESGNRGVGRYEIKLKGNPNAPETLLADTFWFCRYRHTNDIVQGTDWNVPQSDNSPRVNFTWAGAGNSDPLHDFDLDGLPDYRAQLASGWIKRVLDAVNPYEARIRDFDGNNPATASSMLQQFGARFEGPVALNPEQNVIENVGLIELYETILKRARDLSIDLSRPVNTPAVANALQLASTRISDFYTILGNEAYADAQNPTIGFGSDSVEYGTLAPAVFAFQNQLSSLLEEELGLLRGVDDFFARPVYNRLFWNFTQGEGTAAYAMNYNVSDVNMDGFMDEDDAMLLYPQGHGDAWGHYLTAMRHQYELLRHQFFNWVSRSEFYNIQDIVIKVDFLDERKFAQQAAARAKVGSEIVRQTYRQKFVQDPNAQWQGYVDSNKDRAWGVQDWARRAGQGAYFDWVTACALLPSQHPNTQLEGIQKVDRKENSDLSVVSANLNAIQTTLDDANKGHNPLGVARNAMVFDLDSTFLEVGSTAQIGTRAVQALVHFDQIYERALKMMEHAVAVWDNANEDLHRIRQTANSEAQFRNDTFQQDLAYRNELIRIFGTPYEGTIGPGKLYPAGYDGPDLLLYMYVDVRTVDSKTVPGPAASFAAFDSTGTLNDGDIYDAFQTGQGNGPDGLSGSTVGRQTLAKMTDIPNSVRLLFSPTFAESANVTPIMASNGLFAVNYTDLVAPKVQLANLTNLIPITAAGYTFQAPAEWGRRRVTGELQTHINQMLQQEAAIASAIGAWDSLQGDIVRTLRLINAKLDTAANIRLKNEIFTRVKTITLAVLASAEGVREVLDALKDTVTATFEGSAKMVPTVLPTGGLAVSPGDALAPVRGALTTASVATTAGMSGVLAGIKITKIITENGLAIAENELNLYEAREQDALAAKEMIVELENKVGDEPVRRIEIFKEIQALRELSDQYRSLVDSGSRLVDERAAFNKRVAAQTQLNRYKDMTFRVSRNHALQNYRSAFDLAAKYAFLAARAYDYETNFDPDDPGSPKSIYGDIVRARSIGKFDGEPRIGQGGLAEALGRMKLNYDVLKGQLGINNPQIEIGKMSLRTENYRILPKQDPTTEVVSVDYITNTLENSTSITTVYTLDPGSAQQPADGIYGFGSEGQDSDELWRQVLREARVPDLWEVAEFRQYCRPFAGETNSSGGHLAEPGIVLRFATEITAGRNFFGKPLAGGDHAYDPAHFATKIQSVGVWFSDYLSFDPLNDLASSPRVYLVPVGTDIMSVSRSPDPGVVRPWKVLDQRIPVPFPATTARLDESNWIPLIDGLNGQLGEDRKYATFRAYHDGSSTINTDELVGDTRLVGRSVWNTEWVLIIPGRLLNADANVGLDRFIEQVSDIKMVFRSYGISGN